MASSSFQSQSQDTPILDLTQQDTQMTEPTQSMSSQEELDDSDKLESGTCDNWIEFEEEVVKWHGFEVRGRRLQFGFTADKREVWITFYLREDYDKEHPGKLETTIHQAPQLNHMADNIKLEDIDLKTVPEKWLDILSLQAGDINKENYVEIALKAFKRSIGEPKTLRKLDGVEWKYLNSDQDDWGDMYLDGYFDHGEAQGIDTYHGEPQKESESETGDKDKDTDNDNGMGNDNGNEEEQERDTSGASRSLASVSWNDAKNLQAKALLGKLPFNNNSLEKSFFKFGFIRTTILVQNATKAQKANWVTKRKRLEAEQLMKQPPKVQRYRLYKTKTLSVTSRHKGILKDVENLRRTYSEKDNPICLSKDETIVCRDGTVPREILAEPKNYVLCTHLRRDGLCDDLPCRSVTPLTKHKLLSWHAYRLVQEL